MPPFVLVCAYYRLFARIASVYSTINTPMFCPIDRVLYASELT
nr:MAG TPA: hypothetical protein [Caudoviricetes sp.]